MKCVLSIDVPGVTTFNSEASINDPHSETIISHHVSVKSDMRMD